MAAAPQDPDATSWHQAPTRAAPPPQASDPDVTYMEVVAAVRAVAGLGQGVAPRGPGTTRLPPGEPLPAPAGPPSHPDVTTWEDAASVAAAAHAAPTRVQGPAASDPTLELDAAVASGLAGAGPTRLVSPSSAGGVGNALSDALQGGQGLTWSGGGSGTIAPGSGEGATRAAPAGAGGPVPLQVGRYAIQQAIASGGMGAVYQAHDPQLNRKVALKLMRPLGPEYNRRFQVEARASARLDHPNIVGVYDAGEVEGRPYLIMALVEGESLQSRLDRDGPLPPAEVARIGVALAGALAYAHRQQVLHRDLKPENVLVSGAGHPLITDFGLAKLGGEQGGPTDLTQPGTVLGTPAFMSPEQAQGLTDQIDARTDVYSLGATLYALLTNRPPVDGPNATAVIKAVPRSAVPSPCSLRPDVPRPLADVVMRCLAKSPDARFASMQELESALKQALRLGSGRVAAAAPPEQPGPQAPRKRRASAVAAARSGRNPVQVADHTGQTVVLVAVAVGLFAIAFVAALLTGKDPPVAPVAPPSAAASTGADPSPPATINPSATPAASPEAEEVVLPATPLDAEPENEAGPVRTEPTPATEPSPVGEAWDDDGWGSEEDAWGRPDGPPPPRRDGPPPPRRDGPPPPRPDGPPPPRPDGPPPRDGPPPPYPR